MMINDIFLLAMPQFKIIGFEYCEDEGFSVILHSEK